MRLRTAIPYGLIPRFRRSPTPAFLAMCVCCLLVIVRALTVPAPIAAQRIEMRSRVLRVIDGDTLELEDRQRVRLLGLDAPEMASDAHPAEPWAVESAGWLSDQTLGHMIRLQTDASATDKYGRTLAWVYTESGTLINAEALRYGMARLLDDYGLPPDLEPSLRQAESEAKIRRRGVWSDKAKMRRKTTDR